MVLQDLLVFSAFFKKENVFRAKSTSPRYSFVIPPLYAMTQTGSPDILTTSCPGAQKKPA
jgi:hypothetical protein